MNKEDFPMFKQNITYLDNGATTFKPKCVIDKIADYYFNKQGYYCLFDLIRELDKE